MLGLSIPILSYKTDQSGADLFLTPRWGLVAIICAIVFGVRLLLHAFTASRAYTQGDARAPHQATEPVHARRRAPSSTCRGSPFPSSSGSRWPFRS